MIAGNLKSAFLTLRAAANNVSIGGRIIGIGSNSKNGTPTAPIYSVTKGAMGILCNALAQELAPKEITVNTVHPGPTSTDIVKGILTAMPEYGDKLASLSLFNRVATTDDIGAAVRLLVQPSAQWINGQEILLTGGGKAM